MSVHTISVVSKSNAKNDVTVTTAFISSGSFWYTWQMKLTEVALVTS
jgi:succinate-acetate transporter protein